MVDTGDAPREPGSGQPAHGRDVEAARHLDYEQTVGVIAQLTDVRFKLAAFIPALTGAAVALISSSKLDPWARGALALGGLVFALGIVLYDSRNTQLYNSATGRAQELEKLLFERYGGDAYAGVFGSRRDTTRTMSERNLDYFKIPGRSQWRLSVRHGPALSLVYTSVVAVWVWALFDAAATGIENSTGTAPWQRWVHDHVNLLPVLGAAVAARWFYREHRRHDPSS